MTRSTELKKYCTRANITLEKCRKAGHYLLSMAKRPDVTMFCQIKRDLEAIGYTWILDGQDSEGYFFTIKVA